MRFITSAASGLSFITIFFMGALHPVLGLIYLAVWLCVLLPFFWRRMAYYNSVAIENRQRRNIETQILRGKLDGKLVRDVAGEMKRDGRL